MNGIWLRANCIIWDLFYHCHKFSAALSIQTRSFGRFLGWPKPTISDKIQKRTNSSLDRHVNHGFHDHRLYSESKRMCFLSRIYTVIEGGGVYICTPRLRLYRIQAASQATEHQKPSAAQLLKALKCTRFIYEQKEAVSFH